MQLFDVLLYQISIMKAIYHVLVVLCLGGMFKNSQAQFAVGCPTGQATGLSDTVIVNTSVSYIIDVVNTGSQDIFGTIRIYIGALDSLFNYTVVDSVDHQPLIQPFVAGDTAQVLVTHQIDQNKFVEGNNTVVIWPFHPLSSTTDSTFVNVFVIYFNIENDIEEQEISQLAVFPNPVQDQLNLVANEGIEQVRIFDLSGRLISTLDHPRTIQMNEFTPGIYLIEIKSSTGKIKRIKIVKS